MKQNQLKKKSQKSNIDLRIVGKIDLETLTKRTNLKKEEPKEKPEAGKEVLKKSQKRKKVKAKS